MCINIIKAFGEDIKKDHSNVYEGPLNKTDWRSDAHTSIISFSLAAKRSSTVLINLSVSF